MRKRHYESRSIFGYKANPLNGRSLESYEAILLFDRADLYGASVLDLGAGPKLRFASELAESGISADVISLSPSFADPSVGKALRVFCPHEIAIAGLGQALPFRDGSFDFIFALHVYEWISRDDFLFLLAEMSRTLAHGGKAFIGPMTDIPGIWYPDLAAFSHAVTLDAFSLYGVTCAKAAIQEGFLPGPGTAKDALRDDYSAKYDLVLVREK